MTTIAKAIAPQAVPRDEVVRRYPGPAGLVSRILGVVPHAWGLLEVWPPALTTYNLSVPALMDVPKCDLGRGISPDLRGMVAHASSRAFGCMYCTAHTAIMGTIIGGPADDPRVLDRVGGAAGSTDLDKAQQAAIDYARAVGAVPHEVTQADLDALASQHTPDHVEGIVLIAVVMGFLNRAMDTLGTPLETAVQTAAADTLIDLTDWDPGKHQQPADAADRGERLSVASRLRMLREVPGAVAYERRALAGVPTDREGQRALLQDRMGFVPAWLDLVNRATPRRLLVHWVIERLLAEGAPHTMSVATKTAAGWVHALAAGNPVLAVQMGAAALRHGVAPADLRALADGEGSSGDNIDTAALDLAVATSGGAGRVDAGIIDQHVAEHGADGTVEMVLALSIVAGLHRLTVSVGEGRAEDGAAAAMRDAGLAALPALQGIC